MVLEESSHSEGNLTTDDVPPSDLESTGASRLTGFTSSNIRTVKDAAAEITPNELRVQYRVNEGPLRRYQIPFDRMPLQGFGRKAAFGRPGVTSITSYSLVDLMSAMEALNGRPLTQLEAEGVALHVSRKQVYTSIAFYGGIFAGGLAAFARRKTFKFPFRKPKPVERYNLFPLQRAPLLTGEYARGAWHATRGLAYVAVAWSFLIPFYEYLGRNAQTMHLMRDERTRKLAQEFAQSMQRARQEQYEDRQQKMRRGVRVTSQGRVSDQSNSASDQPDPSSSGFDGYDGGNQGEYVQDDSSPSSSSQYPYSDLPSNTGIISDTKMQSRVRSQRPSSSSDPSTRNTFDIGRVERQPRAFGPGDNPPTDPDSSESTFLDDVSPTAENDTYPDPRSTSPAPSGSTWARVRQSARSNTSPPRDPSSFSQASASPDPNNKRGIIPPHMRPLRSQSASARQLQQKSARDEHETDGDSFSFSKEGQDSQLAKEQAQKEFDRMVEEERRGEKAGPPQRWYRGRE